MRKCIALQKNRTVSWGLLSDLSLNVSPSFSRYDKVFCPSPLVCSAPGAEFNSAGGGRKKTGGQKKISRPSGASLPPLKKNSALAKINPAHATCCH